MKKKIRKIIERVLKEMALSVLRDRKPEIIAITGSVGKSTTKEAIFSVLKKRFANKVWKNEGNLNEEIGVPLTILGFKRAVRWFEWPVILILGAIKVISYKLHAWRAGEQVLSYPKILVLELAANKPGDIEYLTSFVKPKIGVVTAIGLAHTEFFKNLKNIIKEKGRLVEVLPRDGYAVLNQDDPEVKKMVQRTRAQVLYYQGGSFESEKEAARVVGQIYQLSDQEIEAGLTNYQPLPHRMNIVQGIRDTMIIDDCYNANPLSMERALKKLQMTEKSRKIAVLGDMLELGQYSGSAHRQIIEKAVEIAHLLIVVGPEFKKALDDLSRSAVEIGPTYHFENSSQAADFLLREMRKGDIILVKGSRGMRMEFIVDRAKIKKQK